MASFLVAVVLISLYRAIETTSHIFAFLFLSSLIVMLSCLLFLEVVFLEFAFAKVVNLAHNSKLIFGILVLAFIATVVMVLPTKIIQGVKVLSDNQRRSDYKRCLQVFDKLLDSAASAYDIALLNSCEFTRPLTKITPTQTSDIGKKLQNWPLVFEDYMGLFAKNSAFALSALVAMVGGASYSALIILLVKKGFLLLLGFFSRGALEIFVSERGNEREG